MKRMLSVLVLFAIGVSLSCLADSTDAAGLFKSKCAMCHGPDGTGSAHGPRNSASRATNRLRFRSSRTPS